MGTSAAISAFEMAKMKIALLLGILIFLATDARADVLLFDSGIDLPEYSYFSDQGRTQSEQRMYARFQLEQDAEISLVEWTGTHANNGSPLSAFLITFFTDTNPDPSVYDLDPLYNVFVPTVNVEDTGQVLEKTGSQTIYRYQADLGADDVVLDGGADYFLSIYNRTSSADWSWGADRNFGTSYYSNVDTNLEVTPFDGTMDFTLRGFISVPEPGAVSVLLLSLSASLYYRRKRVLQ